jgi:surface protein
MIVKLDFDTFKDGRVGRYKVIGMRYNHKDIFSLIGKYNAYTIEVTKSGKKTVEFDTSSDYYYNDLEPYFNMGDGSRFYNNISSYTYKEPGTYLIITSARIIKAGSGHPEVTVVNGIRRDTISLEGAFERYLYVDEFAPQNLKTTRVTSMKNMFCDCWHDPNRIYEESGYMSSVHYIVVDFSKWDTSNVTDMSGMFSAPNMSSSSGVCTFVPSGLNTSNVTNMNRMFYRYNSDYDASTDYYGIRFDSFDTSNVTDMSEMFRGIRQVTLDIEHFNTKNVTTFRDMFRGSYFAAAKSYYFDENNAQIYIPVDFNKWDTGSATDMSGMFYDCRIGTLDLSGWDTNNVTDMSSMFCSCKYLTTLDIPWDTGNVINMSSMFESCSSLQTLDLSGWDTSRVTNMSYMFSGCNTLTSLDLSGWEINIGTNMFYMLYSCHKLRELRLGGCSLATINMILSSASLPTNSIGETRIIYCDRKHEGRLSKPSGWDFSYID